MTTLARRSDRPELMDGGDIPFREFRECLIQLERINRATLAYRPTLAWLDRLIARQKPDTQITILDVGFGHGDMLRRIAAWSRQRRVAVRLTGIDLNPWSALAARIATPPTLPIRYDTADVFAAGGQPPDIVISSLFAHHLDEDQIVRFLRWLDEHAVRGWFINDLHRHRLPYAIVRAAAGLLPVNRLVRHDAPLSVARSFRRVDWCRLLGRAAIDPAGIAIEWFFPFRYGVGRIA